MTLHHVKYASEYSVADNPYENIYVDLTYRCNMRCNYCYNPDRTTKDMDIGYFEEVCRRLPGPVSFRFVGGEPTLHPELINFIITAKKHGHHVSVVSNGLNFNNDSFMERLGSLDVAFATAITMNGGYSRRDAYIAIDNKDCLEEKLSALENLRKFNIGRVTIACIVVRGINESVIGELIDLASNYSGIVRYIHFRTAAKVGRWTDTDPYTMPELKELVRPHFTLSEFLPQCLNEISCQPDSGMDCCYRFRPTRRLQVSLIEFATGKSASCKKRGQLLFEGFIVQPYFANMIKATEASC
jgi:molybdenum cofactor biosynthesis enzyme MoaA